MKMNRDYMHDFLTSSKQLIVVLILIFSSTALATKYHPHEIKAVYIYKIANFVKWPNEENRKQLNICFQGSMDVQRTFLKITANKTIRGMPLVLAGSGALCDLVYIADRFTSHDYSHEQLIIGDKKGFVKNGGFIELRQQKGKIKIIINLSQAQNSLIKVSSKLMRIATLVKEEG